MTAFTAMDAIGRAIRGRRLAAQPSHSWVVRGRRPATPQRTIHGLRYTIAVFARTALVAPPGRKADN